jgi:hypothetical protein
MFARILLVAILFVPLCGSAQPKYPNEQDWIRWISNQIGGIPNQRVDSFLEVDIVTPGYAYEVEYSCNWQRAIGKAGYAASRTDRKPGLILIETGARSKLDLIRASSVCRRLGIRLLNLEWGKTNDW